MKDGIIFEVKKHLAVLSTINNYQKQANIIVWNDGEPRLDVRMWKLQSDGTQRPLKGLY